MRSALSLVEVLISVMLISVVIVSILQIKENNLGFIEKGKISTQNSSYISMVALDDANTTTKDNIVLSNRIQFQDDDIRREFKDIKIYIKDEDLKPIEYKSDEYNLVIDINKVTYSLEEKTKKVFYRFSLSE